MGTSAKARSGLDGKKKGLNKGPKDFKRKTAKVGRKVQRDNVTEIKVAIKHIHIPMQTSMIIQAPADERATLDKLYKQLKHYSVPIRMTALTQITNLISSSAHTESYISILVPKCLELLFDEDGDVRKNLLTLMADLIPRHNSMAFASVISVAVTYICSGLTSLNIYIKRDALSLLAKFTDNHALLMQGFAEKLTVNVAALINEAAAIVDQQQSKADVAIPNSRTISSPRQNHKLGIETQAYGQITKFKKLSKEDRIDKSKVKALPDKKINYVLTVLQVLRSISKGMNMSTSSIKAAQGALASSKSQSMSNFDSNGKTGKLGNAMITLSPRVGQKIEWAHNIANMAWTPHATLEKGFFAQLRILWSDLIGRTKTTVSIALILTEIAELVMALCAYGNDAGTNSTVSPQFYKFSRYCFHGFPFSEAFQNTAAHTDEDRKVYAMLEGLDLTLCQVGFVLFPATATVEMNTRTGTGMDTEIANVSDTPTESVEAMSRVIQFLLHTLSEKTNDTVAAAISTAASAATAAMTVTTIDNETNFVEDTNANAATAGGRSGSGRECNRAADRSVGKDMHMQQDLMRRLWQCLERVLPRCAAASASAVSVPKNSVAKVGAKRQRKDKIDTGNVANAKAGTVADTDSNSDQNTNMLWNLVGSLRIYITEVGNAVLCSQNTGNVDTDTESMLRPAIYCVCHAAVSHAVWFETVDFCSNDIFTLLVECLVQLPSLLMVTGSRQAYIDDSICMPFAQALHVFISRCDHGHKCMPQLSKCVLCLFQFQLQQQNISGSSARTSTSRGISFYSLCSPTLRKLLLDIFFITPFHENECENEQLFNATIVVIDCIIYNGNIDEKRYFLSLYLARRAEMSVDEVLDGLFHMLREVFSKPKAKRIAASSISVFLNHALACSIGDWFCGDVASSFHRISSSHAPTKILLFILPVLKQIIAQCTVSSSAFMSVSTSAITSVDASTTNATGTSASILRADLTNWLVRYQSNICVLQVLSNITTPLFQRLCLQNANGNKHEKDDRASVSTSASMEEFITLREADRVDIAAACRTVVQVAIHAMSSSLSNLLGNNAATISATEQLDVKRAESRLWAPFVSSIVGSTNTYICEILLGSTSSAAAELSNNQTDKHGMFTLFLDEWCSQWKAASTPTFVLKGNGKAKAKGKGNEKEEKEDEEMKKNKDVDSRQCHVLLRVLKRVLEHDQALAVCMSHRQSIYITLSTCLREMQVQSSASRVMQMQTALISAEEGVDTGMSVVVTDSDILKLLKSIQ